MDNASASRSFTIFNRLPVELRLKVWEQACAIPRTIDIWTDFTSNEVDNSIFFSQSYHIELAHLPHPALLSVSHEARQKALEHYSPEFEVITNPTPELLVTHAAKWCINWETDIFVPKGYWNLISFGEFMKRGLFNGLERLAIDVNGSFWMDNVKHYVGDRGCWPFETLRELIIYGSKGDPAWKGHDHYSKFHNRTERGPMGLEFVELEEKQPSEDMEKVQRALGKLWDGIEGKVKREEPSKEVRYLRGCDATTKEYFVRPEVKLMKLVRGISE